MSTHAEPDGDDWVLNGDKLWCTNGTIANIIIVMAQTPPKEVRVHPRINVFHVQPSVEHLKAWKEAGAIPNIYLWSTTHNARTFVDKLDFRSGIGWGDGGDHRERLGMPGGPQLCVTNLCVFDFHPESKAMRIRSLHPGVTVEQVQEATGFEVLLPDGDIPTTDLPTDEELRILREVVDPTGMRLREFA